MNNNISNVSSNAKWNAGDIKYSVKSTLGSDWALCNGSELSGNYPDLSSQLTSLTMYNATWKNNVVSSVYEDYALNKISYGNNYYWIAVRNGDNIDLYYATTLFNFLQNPTIRRNVITLTSSISGIDFNYSGGYFIITAFVSTSYGHDTVYYSQSITGTFNSFGVSTDYELSIGSYVVSNGYFLWTNGNNAYARRLTTTAQSIISSTFGNSSYDRVAMGVRYSGGRYMVMYNNSNGYINTYRVYVSGGQINAFSLTNLGTLYSDYDIILRSSDESFFTCNDTLYRLSSYTPTASSITDIPRMIWHSGSRYYGIFGSSSNLQLRYTSSFSSGNWTTATANISYNSNDNFFITDGTVCCLSSSERGWLNNEYILPNIPSPSTNDQAVNAFIRLTN